MGNKINTFPASKVAAALNEYYPNAAAIDLFDSDYDVPFDTVEEAQNFVLKYYNSFWRWMLLNRLIGWQYNKLDCDKRAWLFRGYCISVFAKVKEASNNIPLYMLKYEINGEYGRGHAINGIYVGAGGILELDPKPKREGGGLVILNAQERISASLRLC